MLFNREQMAVLCAGLAQRGVCLGTSSWKYPGWRGQLYTDDRYIWRGNFSQSRFERLCLSEYASVFKSVCVDAAFYRFPDRGFLEPLFSQVGSDFLFTFKVTDQITLRSFPGLDRFGDLAGKPNPDFLNADLFAASFLEPCAPYRLQTGLLIFEFSRFRHEDFHRGRDFAEVLDRFLGQLPPGWRYGVEIRNRSFLQPDYFHILARHRVAHIYNSWQDMPPLAEQYGMPETRTVPEFLGARLLLKPGRKYEEAVRLFSPYNQIKDPYPEGRNAGARMIGDTVAAGGATKSFIYVNNRFEGNALETIAAMLQQAGVAA